ncbi:putative D,D-dipeptide transport ATP-binding protein DdpF [compost metagenome]
MWHGRLRSAPASSLTAGLDVSVQGEILNLMANLQADYGLGYLIITHNLPVIRHISDRIAIKSRRRRVRMRDPSRQKS